MNTKSFLDYYNGSLSGILNEKLYLQLIKAITGKWFHLDFSLDKFQVSPLPAEKVASTLLSMQKKIREQEIINMTYPYTYIYKKDNPEFIKTYDPLRCGSSCSLHAPDPWGVFSKIPPTKEELKILESKRT